MLDYFGNEFGNTQETAFAAIDELYFIFSPERGRCLPIDQLISNEFGVLQHIMCLDAEINQPRPYELNQVIVICPQLFKDVKIGDHCFKIEDLTKDHSEDTLFKYTLACGNKEEKERLVLWMGIVYAAISIFDKLPPSIRQPLSVAHRYIMDSRLSLYIND